MKLNFVKYNVPLINGSVNFFLLFAIYNSIFALVTRLINLAFACCVAVAQCLKLTVRLNRQW